MRHKDEDQRLLGRLHRQAEQNFYSPLQNGNIRSRRTWLMPQAKERDKINLRGFSNMGGPEMCDYSLHDVASRAAKLDDKLVVTDFAKTITRGFAAVGEPDVAVCVLPGNRIGVRGPRPLPPRFKSIWKGVRESQSRAISASRSRQSAHPS